MLIKVIYPLVMKKLKKTLSEVFNHKTYIYWRKEPENNTSELLEFP